MIKKKSKKGLKSKTKNSVNQKIKTIAKKPTKIVTKSKKKIVIKKKIVVKQSKKVIKKIAKKTVKKRKVIKKESLPVFSAETLFRAKIKVVGIGGGGGSIVSEIGRSFNKATFVIADTDIRALK